MISILSILVLILLNAFNLILVSGKTYSWEGLVLTTALILPELSLNLHLDALAYLFTLLVTIIGFGTNIYILNYFKYESNEDSFILLINWFILSMILLVLANNLFTLFLGWELIGLTSFFLINFWNERRGTLKSAFKAFIFNKISDFFLFVFIILVWYLTQQSNILLLNTNFMKLVDPSNPLWSLSLTCLLLCASIKSAQVIGHLWLPDSMEAPVPASALIHSATLVSAGLYLLLRFNILINILSFTSYILVLGAITAAYGGVVAASQTDVKKLLAYSTVSHCGFLFVCAALNNAYLVVIYLFLHGIFKALTFFCVGSFIRVSSSQDTRQMGVLSRYIPVDTILLIICSSNLGGFPFTLGYLYKQLFLASLTFSVVNLVVLGLCFVGMLTSLVYVYRLVYYCAFDLQKGSVNLLLKELSANTSLDKNYWSATTLIQIITVYTLLGLAIYLYILLYSYAVHSNLVLDNFPFIFEANKVNMVESEKLYSIYVNYFYCLYVVVIGVLITIECRREYTWPRKLSFVIFLLIFTFSLVCSL